MEGQKVWKRHEKGIKRGVQKGKYARKRESKGQRIKKGIDRGGSGS